MFISWDGFYPALIGITICLCNAEVTPAETMDVPAILESLSLLKNQSGIMETKFLNNFLSFVVNPSSITDHSGSCPTDGLLLSNQSNISTVDFNQMCPEFLRTIVCSLVASVNSSTVGLESGTPSQTSADSLTTETPEVPSATVWLLGFAFVTVISLLSLLGVLLVPLMAREVYTFVMHFMIGLAVGSLSGSAIFHLIPQSFEITGHNHDYLYKSAVVILGIYVFSVLERVMRIISYLRKEKRHIDLPLCSVQTHEIKRVRKLTDPPLGSKDHNNTHFHALTEIDKNAPSCEGDPPNSVNHVQPRAGHGHSHGGKGGEKAIATVAWMVIFGDGVHNFVDGLSLGAAFTSSTAIGISTSIAIICEELPHELGDFAILLNSGMSVKKALFYNFLSACSCYVGMIVGILLGEMTYATTWVFGFAGGMFLYISLVDMMPEMNQEEHPTVKVFLVQSVGFFIGVGCMFVLAMYASEIKIG